MADKGLLIRIAANVAELKKNLADGTAVINTTTAAMTRLATSLEGNKLVERAQNIVAAVHQIGGATKLTEGEKARLNATLTTAIEKYQVMGQVAPQAMRDLEAETRKVGAATVSADSATDLFQQRWAGFTAAAATAVVSVQAVVTQLSSWVAASSAQENATVRLETALRSQGTFTPALTAQYAAMANEFQKTTVNADELTMEMQALLVQVGNVMPAQMDAALQAAMNLAAGLSIDLQTATMLVGKAFAGETGTLSRYGIVIDEAALKANGATAVLAALNEKFGGQAAAQADTYSGKMKVVANQFDELKEKAGAMIAKALLPLVDAFTNLSPTMQTVVGGSVLLAGVLVPLGTAIAGIGAAAVLILPVLTAALPAAIAALAALLGPASLIVGAIVGLVLVWKNWDKITEIAKAVYTGVKTWLVDKFDAIVASVKAKVDAVTGFFKGMYDSVVGQSSVPDMVNQIGAWLQKLQTVMVQPAQAATQQTAGFFASLGTAVMGSMGSLVGGVKVWAVQLATNLITPLMNGLTQLQQRSVSVGGSIATALGGQVGGGTGAQIAGIASSLGGAAIAASAWGTSMTAAGIAGTVALGAATLGIGAAAVGVYALAKHFTGLSKAEHDGRLAALDFRAELSNVMTEMQRVEAQTVVAQGANAAWAVTAISVRDAYLAAGLSAEEALAAVDRLWKAEKQGGDAVAKVIAEITRIMQQVPPVSRAAGDAFARAATQGVVGFTQVQDTIRQLTTQAILSGSNSLIMAMHALETEMQQAALSGVQDFSFMALAIEALKEQIAQAISIPVAFAVGPMPTAPNAPASAYGGLNTNPYGGGGGGGGGGGNASDQALIAQIRQFLIDNPFDQHRIASAFGLAQSEVSRLGFQRGTPNLDFMSFPSGGAFARVHGAEAVIPKGSGHQLAAEIAAALPVAPIRGAVQEVHQEMVQLRQLLERRERALPHLMSRMLADALATTTRR